MKGWARLAFGALAALAAAGASGHETHAPAAKKPLSKQVHPWGREGDPAKAARVIAIDMADTMRFTPAEVRVKRGDTVTFAVRNTGQVTHEMVIGTEESLRRHAEAMKRHPGMEHDDPYMAHVKPGAVEKIT
jgi:uncharacterized cupredoxin-like copper-binding protein